MELSLSEKHGARLPEYSLPSFGEEMRHHILKAAKFCAWGSPVLVSTH